MAAPISARFTLPPQVNHPMTPRVSLFIALMTFLSAEFLVGARGTALGQDFPPVTGLEITVNLASDADPAIGDALLASIRKRSKSVMSTVLGLGAKVDIQSPPGLQEWLAKNDLENLSNSDCKQLGCDQSEKNIVLDVRYRRGCFYLSSVEFDRHFDLLGPVQRAEIVQREMVPEAASRLLLNCWTPVGVIQSFRDGKFQVSFANMSRLMSVPNWSRMKKDAVLQPYREVLNGNQLRQESHPTQFLSIRSVSPRGGIASPVGTRWDKDWFQYLGDGRARYLVRRVAPKTGIARVKVLVSGTVEDKPDVVVPRGGCDIYVHEQPETRRTMMRDVIAVTGRDGIGAFKVDDPKPVYLTVAYENQLITQPFVPGVSPEPVLFQFRYLANQSDYLNDIAIVHDQLRSKAAVINGIIQQISETAKDGNDDTIKQLGDRAIQLSNVDDLLERIDEIEKKAESENLDLSQALTSARDTATQLTRQTTALRTEMADAATFAAAEKALTSIQGHWDAMRWPDALTELRRFAAKYPDHPQSAKLESIRKIVEPSSPELAQARKVVVEAAEAANFASLASQWVGVRNGLNLMLQEDDALYLAIVNSKRESWMKMVNAEIQSIKDDNVAAAKLRGQERDDAAAALKRRVANLKPVREDLDQLGPQILKVAQTAKELLKTSAP